MVNNRWNNTNKLKFTKVFFFCFFYHTCQDWKATECCWAERSLRAIKDESQSAHVWYNVVKLEIFFFIVDKKKLELHFLSQSINPDVIFKPTPNMSQGHILCYQSKRHLTRLQIFIAKYFDKYFRIFLTAKLSLSFACFAKKKKNSTRAKWKF